MDGEIGMKALDGHRNVVDLLREALAMLDAQGARLAAIHVSHALDALAAPEGDRPGPSADRPSKAREPGLGT
jgi:hypothetical protein